MSISQSESESESVVPIVATALTGVRVVLTGAVATGTVGAAMGAVVGGVATVIPMVPMVPRIVARLNSKPAKKPIRNV